jgi:hypothetical protein
MSTLETTPSAADQAMPQAPALAQQPEATHELPLEEGPLQFRISVRRVRHEVHARGVLAE